MPFCAQCGTQAGNTDRFCKSCGNRLEPVSAAPQPSAPPRQEREWPEVQGGPFRKLMHKVAMFTLIPFTLLGLPLVALFLMDNGGEAGGLIGGLILIVCALCWLGIIVIGIRMLIEAVSGKGK